MESPPVDRVAEVLGTYGPFTFSERLFQKIWNEGAFDQSRLETVDGQRIRIERRGQWNGLGGPDFRRARLRIGAGEARVLEGDIELHLYASDWASHGHARDPAYDRVVLHVVLFPPAAAQRTLARDGSEIPTVCLLPLLHHDLEEYAAEEAVESLAGRRGADALADAIRAYPADALRERLMELARQRWEQKLRYASLRLRRGFVEACHQTALEILGFRFNRVPMLNLALRYPLAAWSGGLSAEEVEARFAEEAENWVLGAVRPANQPRRRLAQYAQWAEASPQWPERLGEIAVEWLTPSLSDDTRAARRDCQFAALREGISRQICGGVLGGTRFDTLICDGLLPLAALRTGRDFSGLWWHWWAGDLPGFLLKARSDLRNVLTPLCQGAIQGLIAWAVEIETAWAATIPREA